MTVRRAVLAAAGLLVIAALVGLWLRARAPEAPPPTPTFAGSDACVECHAGEYARWRESQHALAMQVAGDDSVLGRFDDAAFTDGAVTSHFSRRDGGFIVNTEGPDGKPADFAVKYAFGVYPLQQYLVPFPDGRLQALGVAWDARPQAAGGQRWFHLYAGQSLQAGDPLHWTGIEQNWNYQCADCHSTNVRKNYDAARGSFATTWSEISVGCEACHGPASNHVAWAARQRGWRGLEATKGLVNALDERRGVSWTPQETGTARRSAPRATSREIDTCARCHARRGQYSDDIRAGANWLDAFRPALLEPGLYHADGQQRDEVYTWGSFLQSRMHAAGVTCADCHDAHTQKLRAPGNGVCAQCHAPAIFDAATHHRHEPGAAGTACVDCHMPATTYMVVDPRHDHSLRVPRPDRSVKLGTPNACSACHAQRSARWAADVLAVWAPQRKPGFQSFAEAFAAAERGEPAAGEALLALIAAPEQPALIRASAVARAASVPSAETLAAVTRALGDPDALVRATAAEVIGATDPATRAERLTPLLRDPVRLVRMAAARALAGAEEDRLLGDERAAFAAALEEWIAAQRFNADRPEALVNLGSLQLERRAIRDAVASFRRALDLDPTFIPAAVNLAEAHRIEGDEQSAEQALRTALAREPAAAAAHHALGLVLVRQARREEGIAALGKAYELAPDDARFAYVYAVALHDAGEQTKSLAVLRKALATHPADRDLRDAVAAYEPQD